MTGITLGIDPGKQGAIAALDHNGHLIWIDDIPNLAGTAIGSWLHDRLNNEHIDSCWIEQVHAMPKQGVTSVFTFGLGYGALLGALGALHIRTHHVTPNMWKKAYRLNADKNASRQRASELWPSDANRFQRVKDDGRAEAALIANYGRSQQTTSTGAVTT